MILQGGHQITRLFGLGCLRSRQVGIFGSGLATHVQMQVPRQPQEKCTGVTSTKKTYENGFIATVLNPTQEHRQDVPSLRFRLEIKISSL